ncbi:MobF family relaxase, partial [Burkholderia gladioli]
MWRAVQQRDHSNGHALKRLQKVFSPVAQHRSSRESLDLALAGRRFLSTKGIGKTSTHTHALVMNATQRADGEWRSLTNDELYVQQKVIGAIYTSSLARGLQKRGYAITAPDANGNFELVGVTREQIEHFSQRSAARDRWLRANGIDPATATPAEKERAVLATR